MIKIHVGCGANVMAGWDNLDKDAGPGVTVCDVRTSLPYAAKTVDFIFSEHFIEHLTLDEGASMFREFARVLKPGGVVRVATPDLCVLAKAYLRGDTNLYAPVGWVPASPAQMLNYGLTLWEHRFTYDERELTRLFESVGFKAKRCKVRMSDHETLRALECRPDLGDLVMESV